MGLPDGPDDPLVYNFGYRSGQPVWTWLNLMRLLDSGIKPDFVLVHIALAEGGIPYAADQQFAAWSGRLAYTDILRLQPYTKDAARFPTRWAAARLTAWSHLAEGIRSDTLPDWQPNSARRWYSWESMDCYGFVPYQSESVTSSRREKLLLAALQAHSRSVAGRPVSPITRCVHRDLVTRCTAEGIVVAFAWTPESSRYRGAYGPAGQESIDEYTRFITDELKVRVFPSPTHLEETDFVDGYHLLPSGAKKYSRWLAETHLKPWLAKRVK